MQKNQLIFIGKIATRYFISSSGEKFVSFMSIFSIIAIALGIFALITTMAFMDAMKLELIKTIIKHNGEIIIKCNSQEDEKIIYDKIKHLDFIKHHYTESIVKSIYIQNDTSLNNAKIRSVYLAGLDQNSMKKFFEPIILDDKSNVAHAFINANLSKKLNIKQGDTISIYNEQTFAYAPFLQTKQVKIQKIISTNESKQLPLSGMSDKIFILNKHCNKQNGVINTVHIVSKNPDINCAHYVSKLSYILRDINHDIFNWQDNNEEMINALQVEKNCMILILLLMLTLSAFVMMSCLFLLVRERFKEICILRTIGATKLNIISIFVLHGFFTSCIGIFTGASLALVVIHYFEQMKNLLFKYENIPLIQCLADFFRHMHVTMSLNQFCYICLIGFIIVLSSTIYPSLKAGNFSPSKGIKQ